MFTVESLRNKGFYYIDNEVYKKLTSEKKYKEALLLYNYFCHYENNNNCYLSLKKFQDQHGIGFTKAKNALNYLIALNLVMIGGRNQNGSFKILLLPIKKDQKYFKKEDTDNNINFSRGKPKRNDPFFVDSQN